MRLLIHLDQGADEDVVREAAVRAGARTVLPARPELPRVLIAVLDDGADAASCADQLGATPGVRAVEGDAATWAVDEEE